MVRKNVLPKEPEPWSRLEIQLLSKTSTALRLDRLLTNELGLSRSRLQKLGKGGLLRVPECRGRVLRQAVRDGTRVQLDLPELSDGKAIASVACGL